MSDLITVNMNKKPIYDICIESDFSGLAAKIKELGFEGKKFMVITDSTVGPLYADNIKEELKDICSAFFLYSFPAGETSKNLDTVTKILKEMVDKKIYNAAAYLSRQILTAAGLYEDDRTLDVPNYFNHIKIP